MLLSTRPLMKTHLMLKLAEFVLVKHQVTKCMFSQRFSCAYVLYDFYFVAGCLLNVVYTILSIFISCCRYLVVQNVLSAAVICGCTILHSGYG